MHGVDSKIGWIERNQQQGAQVIGVELDEDSIPLAEVRPPRSRSIVLLGHERTGLPREVWPFLDQVVEIPMMGVGTSLNVTVAGSLVPYKLAALS